uniref:Formylglycine-generating enzyme, required for sulfatase activity, contains SUMF1/FGE domain n=1 Tax=Candidatus Kentrum sp. FW TaxID=2126338 RepID=A0A450TU81_9GAMM|nr:MAG: Formylglycine-generating enzyme, required for sulfatase activity, contains SUMF1/FGE domain [Candidatus Kentron sp. FW]
MIIDSTTTRKTFRDRLRDGSFGPEMIIIPAGEFLMGSPKDEPKRDSDEGPQHRVRITKSFALGVTEVTFEGYERFSHATGRELPIQGGMIFSRWGRDKQPVINVSWKDAVAYAAWLGKESSQDYRLPSEAEWEYAARAGTTTPFYTGDCIHTDQANYKGKLDYIGCGAKTGIYRRRTVSVGTLPPNPWGLYEMHGNVWEWTEDCWHDDYEDAPMDGKAWDEGNNGDGTRRVVRGGAWDYAPRYLRSANRYRFGIDVALDNLGFRLARVL